METIGLSATFECGGLFTLIFGGTLLLGFSSLQTLGSAFTPIGSGRYPPACSSLPLRSLHLCVIFIFLFFSFNSQPLTSNSSSLLFILHLQLKTDY